MCGSPLPRVQNASALPSWVSQMPQEAVDATVIPGSFDPLKVWPHCAPIIGHVRNQGPCGDCWAFGGTQMMQDRFCVVTGKNDSSQLLSVEDVIACMDQFIGTPGQGCGGGDPINTYYYMGHEGIVSGGDYGDVSADTCLPYLVPPSARGTRLVSTVPTPKCAGQNKTWNHPFCVSGYKKANYTGDKRVASTFTCPGGSAGVKCIQAGLMSGSGATGMEVFGDIWSYKSGLYKCGNRTGGSGHAVVLVGWGTDTNGTDYWRVKNSWGPKWGDGGFFNIQRGINECGIEGCARHLGPCLPTPPLPPSVWPSPPRTQATIYLLPPPRLLPPTRRPAIPVPALGCCLFAAVR